jgi:hypothetical protein
MIIMEVIEVREVELARRPVYKDYISYKWP